MNSHPPGAVDPAVLYRLVEATGGDPEFVGELIEEFARDADAQVTAMREAVSAGDGTGLTRAAHTLKSTAASFGATHLSDLCRALEADARAARLDHAAAAAGEIEAALAAAVAALSRWRDDLQAES